MKTLRFEGSSDDLFGEYGATMQEQDGYKTPVTYEVKAEGKSVFVTGEYSRHGTGTWGIDVAPAEEDNFPDWKMRIFFEGYSTILEMDVPDDAEVEYINKER